ncbi:MAG: hypothetical protein QNJ41_14745 [Xenococcaceae cyanobacterium MO_188.B32]|nr:hypothetical protein [Xenococcaceae cyanobacterium MO_188.B32]
MPKWIFEFFDYAAVIFELSAFIALLNSRKWWLFWLFIACLFHLSNTLLLNIPFMSHCLVYLVFVDFSRLIEPRIKNIGFSLRRKINYFLIGLVTCLSLPYLLGILNGKSFNFFPNLILYNSVIIWTFVAIIIFINLLIVTKKSAIELVKLTENEQTSRGV